MAREVSSPLRGVIPLAFALALLAACAGAGMGRGNPTWPLSAHGYLGVEREVTGAIVAWAEGKTPPARVAPEGRAP